MIRKSVSWLARLYMVFWAKSVRRWHGNALIACCKVLADSLGAIILVCKFEFGCDLRVWLGKARDLRRQSIRLGSIYRW